MIYSEDFKDISKLNNFIVNESITRSEIINIETINSDGYYLGYTLWYFKPSIIGDSE